LFGRKLGSGRGKNKDFGPIARARGGITQHCGKSGALTLRFI
jgi:hypothetical protein